MKSYLLICCCILCSLARGQGTTCATAINIPMNGASNTYTPSGATGNNVYCTGTDNTPFTWFRFTTNANADCPLLNITAADGQPMEAALYSTCTSSPSSSSMCFEDGTGLYAPSQAHILTPNKTYYLRVKTSTSCNITISGQHYVPTNNSCAGATNVGSGALTDNNACNKGGVGVTGSQLCAVTIDNTAFYQFYVQNSGHSIINISNIQCDNNTSSSSTGFQIGFFTGTCDNLTWVNCTSGSGNFVQATTDYLTAGTRVFVAIDGFANSRCSYTISGINVTGVLNTNFHYFSAWKHAKSNMLRWKSSYGQLKEYIIERSGDGHQFTAIGKISLEGSSGNNRQFSFEDLQPLPKSIYRIRQVDLTGYTLLSHSVTVLRDDLEAISIRVNNPVSEYIKMQVYSEKKRVVELRIFSVSGQVVHQEKLSLLPGMNQLLSGKLQCANGQYLAVLSDAGLPIHSARLIKQ